MRLSRLEEDYGVLGNNSLLFHKEIGHTGLSLRPQAKCALTALSTTPRVAEAAATRDFILFYFSSSDIYLLLKIKGFPKFSFPSRAQTQLRHKRRLFICCSSRKNITSFLMFLSFLFCAYANCRFICARFMQLNDGEL